MLELVRFCPHELSAGQVAAWYVEEAKRATASPQEFLARVLIAEEGHHEGLSYLGWPDPINP